MTGKRPILEVISEIEEDLNIFLDLKEKTAGRFDGLCPFHKDSTPSFSVYLNASDDDSRWVCWACCPEGGDVIDFIQKIRNVNFEEAKKEGILEVSEYDEIIRDFFQTKIDEKSKRFFEQLEMLDKIRKFNQEVKDYKKLTEILNGLKNYTPRTKYTIRRLLK